MRNRTCWKSVVLVAAVAALLRTGTPAGATAEQSADAGACPEAQRCLDLLRDGVALIETGRWKAASLVLQGVAAGLEGRPSHARDLALSYVYLGVARLQVSDADEARQWFAEAQMRDPTLQLDPAEFPGDVLELWAEARELGMLLVDTEPAGAEVSVDGVVRGRSPVGAAGLKPGEYRVTLARDGYAGVNRVLAVAPGRSERLFVPLVPARGLAETRTRAAAPLAGVPDGAAPAGPSFGDGAVEQAPVNVLPIPARFPAGTTKKSGRSWWRTLAGLLGVAGGVAMMVETSKCIPGGGEYGNGRQSEPVDILGGTLHGGGHFETAKSCKLDYGWWWVRSSAMVSGRVYDHELLKSGDRDILVITQVPDSSGGMDVDAASLEQQLPDALVRSVGEVRMRRRVPHEYLAGGLALVGVGALLATIWSDVTVVDDLAVGVTPSGGVLASRSFGW